MTALAHTPRITSSTLGLSRTPLAHSAPTPRITSTAAGIASAPRARSAPTPRITSSAMGFSRAPAALARSTPRITASCVGFRHPGPASRYVSNGTDVRITASTIGMAPNVVADYDARDRATHEDFRDADFPRASDPTWIRRNQAFVHGRVARWHDIATGAHPAQSVSRMAGHARQTGVGARPVPLEIGDQVLQLIHAPGPSIRVGYLIGPDVGEELDGVYEVRPAFGGGITWSSFVLLRKVGEGE